MSGMRANTLCQYGSYSQGHPSQVIFDHSWYQKSRESLEITNAVMQILLQPAGHSFHLPQNDYLQNHIYNNLRWTTLEIKLLRVINSLTLYLLLIKYIPQPVPICWEWKVGTFRHTPLSSSLQC